MNGKRPGRWSEVIDVEETGRLPRLLYTKDLTTSFPPLVVGCALLLAARPMTARAQGGAASHAAESACLASIPDSALGRAPVYVQAEPTGSADRRVLPGLDLLTQELADSTRSLLGGAANQLPDGGVALTWRALDTDLDVVVHRDGRILAMHHPFVSEQGVVGTLSLRQAFAIFSLRVPVEDPVLVSHQVQPHYPGDAEQRRVTGNLIMQFIVDTAGHAEMATVKDLWPKNLPRLTGAKRAYYEKFRQSVVRSISQTTFQPARIGGCKVRQLVQMPFAFAVRK